MSYTDPAVSQVQQGLIEQLPISRDATTSRVVVNTPAVRVVLFAMDAGQELTDHSSPRTVVVHVVSGELRFTVAGQSRELGPGDLVYLAPGDRHAVLALSPCHFALTLIDTKSGPPGA